MNCPNDKTAMEKGFINTGYWIAGEKPKMYFFMFAKRYKFMVAWRCPKCRKIEFVSED